MKAVLPLAERVRAGQRRALAKAITLIESSRPDHQDQASALVDALLPHTGQSLRLGLTGVPGAGKSTFIEAFGLHLIAQGMKVAVLAVDPSSARSGGSILGDKTRMERLAQQEAAFIRPSPAGGTLGGVARRTREAILLCEAAGFDVVIVETVGVGQSETQVAEMTDLFVLLALPNAGDELQAIKRGIMELADLIVINKADLDFLAAECAAQQMRQALGLLAHGEAPRVLLASALRHSGVAEVWQAVQEAVQVRQQAGLWQEKRRRQRQNWLSQAIDEGLRQRLRASPRLGAVLGELILAIDAGSISPTVAAARLLDLLPWPEQQQGRNKDA